MKKGLFVMVLVVLLAVFASAVILGGIGGVILDRTILRPGPSYPSAYPQYGYGYGIPSCQDLATDIEQERCEAARQRASDRERERIVRERLRNAERLGEELGRSRY